MACNELRAHIPQVVTCRNRYNFVKKTLQKNDVDIFTFQKRLFCAAIQALLPSKTGSFAMQNKGYCKALDIKCLCDCCAVDKSLQYYGTYFMDLANSFRAFRIEHSY